MQAAAPPGPQGDPGSHTRPVLVLVGLGALLATATGSILNVALPIMARDLGADPATTSWFVLGYLIAVTALLLPAGRLADTAGAWRVYALGFAVFAAGSLGCALAPSTGVLVGTRVLQGVGSSLTMAASPALITLSVPPERRGQALGLLSTATYVGLTIGPPLGGYLIAYLGWRAIFYLSAAVGLLIGVLALRLPRARRDTAAASPRFDPAGATLIGAGTIAFLLVFTRGPAWGPASAATVAAGVALVGCVAAFLVVETRHPEPMLDLRLFRSRVFTLATASALLNYLTLFIAIYLLPFALQYGRGLGPVAVGRVLAAQSLFMALVAGASGALSDRIGSRGLAAAGMAILAASMAGLAVHWPTHGVWQPSGWLALAGLGTGIFISPNSNALMSAAPRARQGIAGGVMAVARNLGMALGIGVASGLFAHARVSEQGPWTPRADQAVRLGLAIGAAVALVAVVLSLLSGGSRPHARGAPPAAPPPG